MAVLVHGTWAPEALWTREGSFFRQQLAQHMGVPVKFHCLDWSGVNSHAHRLKAAEELRELLNQSLKDHAGASHFVVAHSHGGNVGCYALQDDSLREAVRGIVCLGTPFLHVEYSALPRNLLIDGFIVLVVFALFAVTYLFRTPADPMTKYLVLGTIALALPVLLLLLWALLRKRESRLSWRDLLRPSRDPTAFARELAIPSLGTDRLLAVRISSDEAAGALIASQFLVWLFRRTWRALSRVWDVVERWRRAIWACLGIIFIVLIVAGWLGVASRSSTELGSGVVVGFIWVGGLAVMIVGLAAYVLVLLILVMHVPVGLDAMLASLHLQTAAEPTPPSQATVFHVVPRDPGSNTGMRHSALYDDLDVIRFIASWIRARREPM